MFFREPMQRELSVVQTCADNAFRNDGAKCGGQRVELAGPALGPLNHHRSGGGICPQVRREPCQRRGRDIWHVNGENDNLVR